MGSRGMFAVAGVLAIALAAPAAAQNARVSVTSAGLQANSHSYWGFTSPNGRWVVFSSDATDMVPGDANGNTDVFRLDRTTGEVRAVSVNTDGVLANGRSFASGVSKDGRLVLFWSHATDLVGGDRNAESDVFLRDMVLGTTTRLTHGMDGTEPNGGCRFPTMSEDGRWVTFQSWASNIVVNDFNDYDDIFLLDRRTGVYRRIGQPAVGDTDDDSGRPVITPNGRYVSFESGASNIVAGDTNGRIDGFVVDVARGTTTCVSVDDAGIVGDGASRTPILSSNGRYAAFSSSATNLVSGDTNGVSDAFVRDLRRGTTRRISVRSDGIQADGGSNGGLFDPSGRYLAYTSIATNLVPGDTDWNGVLDVYVHDLSRGTNVRVSKAHGGSLTNDWTAPIGFAGRTLFLQAKASNLIADDTNAAEDVFVTQWR